VHLRPNILLYKPGPDPIRANLDLIAVAGQLHGRPPPRNPVSEREAELAHGRG
jgi:hypothetical protein